MSCDISAESQSQHPNPSCRKVVRSLMPNSSEDTLLHDGRGHVKTLLIQLNPNPTIPGRIAKCQFCEQPITILAYRIRTNSNSVCHVRCYEDVHDLEQELIDESVVLSIDEHQIDVEALAYIYQWEANVLGVGADLVGAYAAATRSRRDTTRSDGSDATPSRLSQCAGDDRVSPSDPGLTHVLDAGSGDEDSFEDFEDDCGPFYDGLNQPIADYYLNRPLQPVANGCFAFINIGPAAKGQGNANKDILIPRFPARLSELLDALEKKQNRMLRDHAVFMFR